MRVCVGVWVCVCVCVYNVRIAGFMFVLIKRIIESGLHEAAASAVYSHLRI